MPNLGDAIVGLDDDLTTIIERLIGPPSSALEIVTISGMGGIGKITLARQAYDHLAISCIRGQSSCINLRASEFANFNL
ncbi:hypothetical protein K7X08_020836 [Anisodus acutangulus]|uniref:NB-ARC domain-containing protein n=1 Tax=Anisodus acutangulus TaxID=402998 RepID=A0A9Q1MU94_9SOLA|nr:hypothetical protein K7X08_020836 [Anisodus acutangulus]